MVLVYGLELAVLMSSKVCKGMGAQVCRASVIVADY